MPDSEIRNVIIEFVQPGSMTTATIVDELANEYDEQDVKIAVVELLQEGSLEEHPQFDDVYRVAET